jgi:hypothetical protein
MKKLLIAALPLIMAACSKEPIEQEMARECGCYRFDNNEFEYDLLQELIWPRMEATARWDTVAAPYLEDGVWMDLNYDIAAWYKNECGDSALVWFNRMEYEVRTVIRDQQGLDLEFVYPVQCALTDSVIY